MSMLQERKKGLIISFYLSKFDKKAYERFGLGSQTKTHEYIGKILNIKATTIKNWRDEFDPYENNSRAGWYQRPIRPACIEIKNLFDNIEENSFYQIVENILNVEENIELEKIIKEIDITEEKEEKEEKNTNRVFCIQTALTGEKAEEFFIQNYQFILKDKFRFTNENHKLIDTRLYGCGYDFELKINEQTYYIEIKGISSQHNNIRFTDKEWSFASEKKNNYILAVIKNISPKIETIVIQNPVENLDAERQIQKIVQISWIAKL